MLSPFDSADVAEGQADALASMQETCTIARPTGGTVTDPETWEETPQTAPVAASGVCRVRSQALASTTLTGGEHRFTLAYPEIVLPLPNPDTGKDQVAPGDLLTITTPPGTLPGGIPQGTVYALTSPSRGTFTTAQRWKAERVIT